MIFCVALASGLCRFEVILSGTGQCQTSQPPLAQTSGGNGRFGVVARQGSGQHNSQMMQTNPPQQSQPMQPSVPPPRSTHQQSHVQQRRELPLPAVDTAEAAGPGSWPDKDENVQPMDDDFVYNDWADEDLVEDKPLHDDGVDGDAMEVGGPEAVVPSADRDGRCNTEAHGSPDAAAVVTDMWHSGGAAVAAESLATADRSDAARVR